MRRDSLVSTASDVDVTIAAAWLTDAMNFRPISQKLEANRNPVFGMTRVRLYEIWRSRAFRWLVISAIVAQLFVPFTERAVAVGLKVYVILIYTLREGMSYCAHDFVWRHRVRQVALVAMVVDLAFLSGNVRPLFLFGPFFFVEFFPSMRFVAWAMLHSIPPVLPYILLLAGQIITFGCMGHLFFSGEAGQGAINSNFSTIPKSIYSMLYLSTTVNYPDVMMPSYHANGYAAIFFIVHLVIALLILTNWLLAATFSSFFDLRGKQFAFEFKQQAEALSAIFHMVAAPNSTTMPETMFLKLMSISRPELRPEYARVLFGLLDGQRSGHITEENWLHASDFLEIQIEQSFDHDDEQMDIPVREISLARVHRAQLRFLKSRSIQVVLQCLIVVCFWLQLEWIFIDHAAPSRPFIEKWLHIFQIFFLLEIVFRIATFRKAVIRNWVDIIDVTAVVVSSIGLFHFPGSSYLQLALMIRLIRFVPTIIKAEMYNRVVPTVFSSLGLVMCLFYVFALLGNIFFSGLIKDTPASAALFDASDPALGAFWHDTFYYDLNFDMFRSGVVTLFALTIVNNWHLVLSGYVVLTDTLWSSAFFICFYFSSVMLVLNIVTASIIDEFLIDRARGRRWYQQVVFGLAREWPNVPESRWQITRPDRKQLLFIDRLYGDISSIMSLSENLKEKLPWRKTSFRPQLPGLDPEIN